MLIAEFSDAHDVKDAHSQYKGYDVRTHCCRLWLSLCHMSDTYMMCTVFVVVFATRVQRTRNSTT